VFVLRDDACLPCELPVADFTANPTQGYAPLNVSFTDKSTGDPTEWSWNFGDNSTSIIQNPVHVYSTEGTYNVTLTVTNNCGSNSTTKQEYIHVSPPCTPPVANFAADPTSGHAPLHVLFTDTSTGNPTSWTWDFGDTTNSTVQNPVHVYTAEGVYNVTLTVTNECGSDSITKQEFIHVSPPCTPPVANFAADPTWGFVPLCVSFFDASTGGPTSWHWDFGDGGTSNDKNPVHLYNQTGKYNVTLTVANDCGSDTITRSECITVVLPCDLPIANFYAVPKTGHNPLFVQFCDLSTGNIISWHWDFGDGATSSGQNPIHIYKQPGNYTVTLTVTNDCGPDSETKVNYIVVTVSPAGPPVAYFVANPTLGLVPLQVEFYDLSYGDPETWQWSFGDGGTSVEQDPVHLYQAPGTFTVSLTVKIPTGPAPSLIPITSLS